MAIKNLLLPIVIVLLLLSIWGCGDKMLVFRGVAPSIPAGNSILVIPSTAEMVSFDGLKLSSLALVNIGSSYEVTGGTHALTVRYSEMWDFNNQETTLLTSQPQTISVNFEPGKIYELVVPRLKNMRDAQAFAATPEFSVKITGLLQQTAVVKPSPAVNAPAQPTPLTTPATSTTDAVANTPAARRETMESNMLIRLWQNSTAAEREQFHNWLKGQ